MRRALIVDDSRTAQIRLKKLLDRYDLVVDTALSGEDALAYLSYRTPVVIFMDHSMDGMDGFEALKIIKSNPNTAMIPVIMYTAQKGDVYVGQARALGALDILSKEVIKPSNLERVLSALKIRPTDASTAPQLEASNDSTNEPAADPEDTVSPEAPKTPQNAALSQIHSQVARLFEIHIADVRSQITEHTKFIVRRLSKELDKRQQSNSTSAEVPGNIVEQEVKAERNRLGLISSSLLVVILLSLIYLVWHVQQTQSLLKESRMIQHNDTERNQSRAELGLANNEILNLREGISNLEDNQEKLMNILTWALDTDMSYEYSDSPLGDLRVTQLYSLVYMLESAGYRGTILLNIHQGNFCLKNSANGSLSLADPQSPIADCIMRDSLDLDLIAEDYLSLEYLNFEQTAHPIISGTLDIDLQLQGTNQPRYNYPATTSETTAGEWNAIARANNRIALIIQ